MEFCILARCHAREGEDDLVAAATRAMLGPDRAEPLCLAIDCHGVRRDSRLFFIHSRWIDEGAFEIHAELPHTVTFLERVQPLTDHPLDVTRTRTI